MEAILGIMLLSMVNNTEIQTQDSMERIAIAFPGIDFENQCWSLHRQPTTKRKIWQRQKRKNYTSSDHFAISVGDE